MKFQKVKNTHYGIEYDWLLVIDNVQDLWSYHERWLISKVPEAWTNLVDVQLGKAHIATQIGMLINFSASQKPASLIELTVDVSEKVIKTKMDTLEKYGKIYVNKLGGYFPHTEDIEVIDEFETEDTRVVFPNYTEKDIRIKQWPGGTHYYAYVGDFQVKFDKDKIPYSIKRYDVVDGVVSKWNTEEDAKAAAKSFLWRLKDVQYKIKE